VHVDYLPAQAADWTPDNLQTAYGRLASVSVADISDECIAGLKCQFLGAFELIAACYELGEPPPPFWLNWDPISRPSRKKHSNRLRAHAKGALWLHQQLTGAQSSEVRRQDVLEEAKSSHDLTEALFDQLWHVFAPDNLRKKGRRLGSKNRHPRS
jgi:hypothetical protein